MNLRLAELALRRHLPKAIVVVLALAAVLLARASWAPPAEWIAGADPGAVERALTRQGIWTLLLLLAVPLLVARAAGIVGKWRRGEIDWIASSPASSIGVLLSTWAGGALASALAIAGIALAAELAAGASPAGARVERRISSDRALLREHGGALAGVSRELARLDPPPGSRLVAKVVLVAGAPACDVRFALERRSAGARTAANVAVRRISGRAKIEVEIPPGPGELALAIEALDPGALVAFDGDGLALVTPVASERCASLALAARAWIACCAWIALALGAGAWVSGATAALFAFALTAPAWLGEASARWDAWPWSGLPDALELAGEGLVAPPLAWPTLAGALASVALGIALGSAGLVLARRVS